MNDSNKIYIIKYLSDKDQYGFEETNKENIQDLRDKYYKVDNMTKPIKSMSSYKTQDLIDICKKLGIETTVKNDDGNENKSIKNKNKKDLYEAIIKYF
jgi:hypothetical protein